ncbi:MAG: hypothetical protein NDP13_05700 [Crenarchaeota archaeon]|nr:hypothetical protein [Thermoproteota archaeon]
MARYAPTKLVRLTLKTYFTSFTFIFWTILFIEFWIIMWVYVFSRGMQEAFLDYFIALAYGYLIIICLGGAATGMTNIIYNASFSIRYATKFGRINEKRFLVEYFIAHLIMLLVLCAIFNAMLIATAYAKFGKIFYPKKPLELLADLIISLSILYMFAFDLAYINVLFRGNIANIIRTFLPLMLSFVAYGGIWVDYKYVFYLVPQLAISGILFAGYSGEKPVTGNFSENFAKQNFADINLTYLSLISWLIVLVLGGIVLLRKSRGVRVEELRRYE